MASVKPDQWDDKAKRVKIRSHRHYAKINVDISEELARVERLLLEANGAFVHNIFLDQAPSDENEKLTFWEVADLYLQEKKKQSGWTFITFNAIVNKFKDFVSRPGLLAEDIDTKLVAKYIAHMQSLNNAGTTIKNNIKVLRFVANYGFKNNLCDKPAALFEYSLPKSVKTPKVKLTKEELQAFASVKLKPGTKIAEAQDMFLLAVYLRGMRISDLLQLKNTDIKKGRLLYQSSKAGKYYDIKLIPAALEIIERYRSEREYLFSYFKWQDDPLADPEDQAVKKANALKNCTAYINTNLAVIAEKAKLTKRVSSHIARHTFGKMAIDSIKDTNMRMDLLGHSNLRDHETYVREISREDELDQAADDIFG